MKVLCRKCGGLVDGNLYTRICDKCRDKEPIVKVAIKPYNKGNTEDKLIQKRDNRGEGIIVNEK